MNIYLHLKWLSRMLSDRSFTTQAEQSVILLTRERCLTVIISSRHHTYSIKVEKQSEIRQIIYHLKGNDQSFPKM